MNWNGLFFSDEMQACLWRRVARRFPDPLLAEEAFNDALDRLSAEDWGLLRSFRAESSPGTYLVAVFNHCLEEFARSRFGRPRPPAWLHYLGPMWLRIYQLLCLERVDANAVVDLLTRTGDRLLEEVQRAVDTVLGRISDCGHKVVEFSLDDDSDGGYEIIASDGVDSFPDHRLLEREWEQLLTAMRRMLGMPSASFDPVEAGRFGQALMKAVDHCRLTDMEALMLRMVFQDGLKMSEVGRRLALPGHQVRRSCAHLLRRLREAFAAAGFGEQEFRDFMDL
ncbi:MAG: hypothetical protein H7834_12925 [Magnetococcus sp. YQC-9]